MQPMLALWSFVLLAGAAALAPPAPGRTRTVRRGGAADDGGVAAPRRIILFDVLDTLVADPFFRGMHTEVFGCESLEELYAAADASAYEAFETGAIDEAELWRTYFLDRSRPPPDGAAARAYLAASYEYVIHMRSLLGEIKRIGGVEVYALSNYGPFYRMIEEKLHLGRFLEWRFVSCETGLRKPDPACYRHALADLGVTDRDAVVFVDDSATNCDAARAIGLDAIRFNGDSADCRTALIERGFTELRV